MGEIAALYGEWNAALAGIVDCFARFRQDRPLGVVLKSYVRVLRSTEAIDSGIRRFTLKEDGGTAHIDARYTFVHEKIDGKWMIVTHHSSELPEAV